MQWVTVVSVNAETGFIGIKNDSGSALTSGQVVVWDMADTEDGHRVIDPSGSTAALVVGLAHTALADAAVGLAQVYGIRTDVPMKICGSASDAEIAVGDILDILSAQSCLQFGAAGQAVLGTSIESVAAIASVESFASIAATSNVSVASRAAIAAVASVASRNMVPPMFVAAGTAPSTASSSASTRTTAARVFIRCL